jgi:hypothetical protein
VLITTAAERVSLPENALILCYDQDRYPVSSEHVHSFYRLFRYIMDTGENECNDVSIGIDPGSKHVGFAVFVNERLVEATSVPSTEDSVKKYLDSVLNAFSINVGGGFTVQVHAHVGYGNPAEFVKIVNLLLKLNRQDLDIQVVDEFQSNSDYIIKDSNFIKISTHARAAVNIALRPGTIVDKDTNLFKFTSLNVTKKQLRQLQQESRAVASDIGEPITIDSQLATEVLFGTLTLEEAIKMQARKGKKEGSPSTIEENQDMP